MVFRFRSAGVLRALVTLSVILSGAQACGGRSDMDEYSYGAGEPVTAAGRGGAGGAVSVGGVGGTGVSLGGRGGMGVTGPTAGTVGIAGAPSVGGATGGGGAGFGGAIQGGAASSGSPGVAGATDGPTIACGEASCDAETQTCCASGGLRCLPRGAACEGASLGCTSNSDCGEDLCCFSLTGEASAASSCKPRCSMGGTRDRQLCQVDEDCREPFRFCTPTVFGVNICTRRP